jgi:fructose-bisphosphate aldolase class I
MNAQQLIDTARKLVANDKGLLAMDESTSTCNRRFAALGIPQTEETRREYRELIVTTPGLGESISGVILYDETIRQQKRDGTPLVKVITDAGIIPGIKVDTGATALAGRPGEKVTEGLDGLRERLAEYAGMGARFAKWRAVIAVSDGIPSRGCIEANAHALARYAALCQEAGLVPIVEPEVLMDGDHTLNRCGKVTETVLRSVFSQLCEQSVMLEGMILKPNMVLPGLSCSRQETVDAVASATVTRLLRSVPAAVPGIAFLSGGQSGELATARLNAMNANFRSRLPWALSFSFARAIQQPALAIWRGEASHVAAAQRALYHRATCNRAARCGVYCAAMEHQPDPPTALAPTTLAPTALAPTAPIETVATDEPAYSARVLDADGHQAGIYQRSVDTPDGKMLLIAREGELGGGAIVVSASEADERYGALHLPYGEVSIREAPPYSPNVDLHEYFEYWQELQAGNLTISNEAYMPTGSGPVSSDEDVPDDRLQDSVGAALHDAAHGLVDTHLLRFGVNRGTVLLKGYQNDAAGRLGAAKAAASVCGVKEIVNMLVIRAL